VKSSAGRNVRVYTTHGDPSSLLVEINDTNWVPFEHVFTLDGYDTLATRFRASCDNDGDEIYLAHLSHRRYYPSIVVSPSAQPINIG